MELLHGIQQLRTPLKASVLTLGNFDGVHLGHRQMIELTVKKAHALGMQAIAYTFRPHPQAFLRPETPVPLLTTYDEKLKILAGLGLDLVIEEPFDRLLAETDASTFFTTTLLGHLGVKELVVGYDFVFGRQRQGHLQALTQLCTQAGVHLHILNAVQIDGDVISSSRVRQLLNRGLLPEANRLLGSTFTYRGTVVQGEGRGKTLGFPTANLHCEPKLTLPHGVYATRVRIEGKTYPCVTNIGIRPTFSHTSSHVSVETHLLDSTQDLYEQNLELLFYEKLRDERKFETIDHLKTQITLDIVKARSILNNAADLSQK